MKGIRFYEEFTDKRKKESEGNVVAIFLDTGHIETCQLNAKTHSVWYEYECLSATFFHPNSDVSVSSVSIDYLSDRCKRISEKKAREIHPKLFERLDAE